MIPVYRPLLLHGCYIPISPPQELPCSHLAISTRYFGCSLILTLPFGLPPFPLIHNIMFWVDLGKTFEANPSKSFFPSFGKETKVGKVSFVSLRLFSPLLRRNEHWLIWAVVWECGGHISLNINFGTFFTLLGFVSQLLVSSVMWWWWWWVLFVNCYVSPV